MSGLEPRMLPTGRYDFCGSQSLQSAWPLPGSAQGSVGRGSL